MRWLHIAVGGHEASSGWYPVEGACMEGGEAVVIDSNLFGPLVGAAATLGGVIAAQTASKSRERESRLWEMRVETYRDVIKWSLAAKASLREQGFTSSEKISAQTVAPFQQLVRSLVPSGDLTANIITSASDRVRSIFQSSNRTMAELTHDSLDYCTKNFGSLLYQISRMEESIRSEMAIREISRTGRVGKWAACKWQAFTEVCLGREVFYYKTSAKLED